MLLKEDLKIDELVQQISISAPFLFFGGKPSSQTIIPLRIKTTIPCASNPKQNVPLMLYYRSQLHLPHQKKGSQRNSLHVF